MVRRGVSATRAEAAQAIRSGKVVVGGRPAVKSSTMVLPEEPIALTDPARRFVSRGGDKLDAALARFGLDVSGRTALDAGASTGGFTDCLLSRGAERVIAVDVGYGQLDWRLREDPRVIVLERTNVRDLQPGALPCAPEVVTADLSFISLRQVLPALARCAAPDADIIALVKPQFEAGRDEVGKGVVADPSVWKRVLGAIAAAFASEGLDVLGVMASPLLGPAGNVEFLIYGRGGAGPRGSQHDERFIDAAIEEAIGLVSTHR
jgi:23S rRNA (cytidine1920-2'-O)/16S rRNA (cytidine1409-2'-O)-methyltransferase